jgi:hypothetical protein
LEKGAEHVLPGSEGNVREREEARGGERMTQTTYVCMTI